MKDLKESRKLIDEIDEQIVDLFEKRMEVSEDVAKYKVENDMPVLDAERQKEKLLTLASSTDDEFLKHGIIELYEQLMAMSRKYQYKLISEKVRETGMGFEIIDDVPKENVRVAYQGIAGAYSQQAAGEYFGDDVTYEHVTTFREAMQAVKEGKADFAVLPFENSSAGIVTDVYDLLVEFDHYIVDTFDIKIEHCLCAVPGATFDDIETVCSHPQAFMQSNEFLEEHGWEKINFANTAISARFIAEQGNKKTACIASANAAEIYGLEILKRGINFASKNTTKFIIITNKKIARKDADKMCISFEMPHERGTLYQMLSHIIYNDLNMTSIQSRPVPEKKWEYRFYVEFEGKPTDAGVINALEGIKAEALKLKILGNY